MFNIGMIEHVGKAFSALRVFFFQYGMQMQRARKLQKESCTLGSLAHIAQCMVGADFHLKIETISKQ